jgi:hypothetical protein
LGLVDFGLPPMIRGKNTYKSLEVLVQSKFFFFINFFSLGTIVHELMACVNPFIKQDVFINNQRLQKDNIQLDYSVYRTH